MRNFLLEPAWLAQDKQTSDVILTTFCRIHRNLSGQPFLSNIDQSGIREIQNKIQEAVNEADPELQVKYLKDFSNTEKRILIEKQIMHEHYIMDPENIYFNNNDESVYLLLNTNCHLTLLSLSSGLSPKKTFNKTIKHEKIIDNTLNFSFSMEFGYLFDDVYALGTGMKLGLIAHLPALQEADIINKIARQLMKAGCEINGFFSEDEESMGALYFIELSPELNHNEKELIQKLESIGQQILHYEREARNDFLESRKTELEDIVWRSYGVLRHCRKIPAEEAILRISDLRLGVYSKIINMPINKITPLLFTVQKAHLCNAFNLKENECDERIDCIRSDYIKSVLFSAL